MTLEWIPVSLTGKIFKNLIGDLNSISAYTKNQLVKNRLIS